MTARSTTIGPARIDGAQIHHGNARFTVITPACVRLEYHPDRAFVDAPSLFAANRDAACTEFSATQDPERPKHLAIETAALRLTFNAEGRTFRAGNTECRFRNGADEARWEPGLRPLQNLGGTIDSLDGKDGPVHLGEGLISRDGWHLIDDSRGHLLVDGWVQSRPDDAGVDWYLFAYGQDFRAALQSLTAVGGPIPLPRKYALGSWHSRWHAYTSEEYREIVDEYEQHNYPLDVLVWDMDWHRQDADSGFGWAWTKGWTGFSWNRKLLPDAEDLLQEMNQRDIAVTLNVHPHDGIRSHEDMYEDFMRDLGRDPTTKENPPFDAGDPDYMAAYFRRGHQPHEDNGVAFWWVDWQQDVDIPFVRSVPGLRHLPWLNELYFRHTSQNNRRGMSFSRWAGWGDHRHPIHFSGDAHTSWEMLAFEVPFTAAAGNVGCFFWSHDLGGFMGESDAETYTRWLQFGAVSAAMRLHAFGVDRRPWKWPEWAERSMRGSFRLRSQLMPYTYSTVAQCCRDSMPLVRSTYIAHPEDDAAYRNPQQYLFGDHFLVAPVVTPGQGDGLVGRQSVYFPDGPWYNWFTGERFEGPQERLVCADLHEMPLYVRGGVPVPMRPFTQRMATAPLDTLIVRCFPGPDGGVGTFTLYEDDGLTRDYQQGRCVQTGLAYERRGDQVTVRVAPARGEFDGMVSRRPCRIELACTLEPTSCRLDGEDVECIYDQERRTTLIEIPERPVTQGAEVTLQIQTADEGAVAASAFAHRADAVRDGASGDAPSSVDEAFSQAEGDQERTEQLLALAGVGVRWKDEDPCGANTSPALKLYLPKGVVDGDTLQIRISAGSADDSRVLLDAQYQSGGLSAIPLPTTSDHVPPPVVLTGTATRNGQRLHLRTTLKPPAAPEA